MRQPLVFMAGEYVVDESGRQRARNLEDLAIRVTAREIQRVAEVLAGSAGVRDDDDQRYAVGPKPFRLAAYRLGQRRDPQAVEVRCNCRLRCLRRHNADNANVDARSRHHRGGLDVGPANSLAGRCVDDVGPEQRECRLRRARLQCAARIVAGRRGRHLRTDRAEIELVIADRGGRVAHRVVGSDDGRAFVEIGFDRTLPHVTCVDQQDVVGTTSRAQCVNVSRDRNEAATLLVRMQFAVHVVCRHDRQRHGSVVDCRIQRAARHDQCRQRSASSQEVPCHAAIPPALTTAYRVPGFNCWIDKGIIATDRSDCARGSTPWPWSG